ncbi:hypothetical protein D3C72_2396630 [compost metagenome]
MAHVRVCKGAFTNDVVIDLLRICFRESIVHFAKLDDASCNSWCQLNCGLGLFATFPCSGALLVAFGCG